MLSNHGFPVAYMEKKTWWKAREKNKVSNDHAEKKKEKEWIVKKDQW